MAYAASSIVVLSMINIVGIREGKWTQNILTAAKIVGLTAIVVIGVSCCSANHPIATSATAATSTAGSHLSFADLGLAMIFVLFTYGGWNEMAYVARRCETLAEHPPRHVARYAGRHADLCVGRFDWRFSTHWDWTAHGTPLRQATYSNWPLVPGQAASSVC